MKPAPQHCSVCRRKPPTPEDDIRLQTWECSHVECPNRRQVTAAPSDQAPPPKENQ